MRQKSNEWGELSRNLEKVVEKKDFESLLPVIEDTMHRFLGVTISELNEDLSSKINKRSLLNISIRTDLSYKSAKREFKKEFVTRLLQINLANVSEAAKVANVDRRSIHRIIQDAKIDINKIRKELIKPRYFKKMAVSAIVEDVLAQYKDIIHPVKLDEIYKSVSKLSEDIVHELPETRMTFDEAEDYFDKEYLGAALKKEGYNISKTARKIGLRYETLYRKIKKLGIMTS